jgi:DNA adenine methylase
LAPKILSFLPGKFERLIEPFAGSAAITIACALENKAENFIVNDLNKPLVELFKLIIEKPEFTAKKYREIWVNQEYDSIEHYYQVRERFNRTKNPICFLYLLARCVKGSVRYNNEGLFNQSPDKRRKGTSPSQMEKNIYDISSLLKGKVEFNSIDYKEILKMASPGDIIYMDPPYQGVCGEGDSRYFSGIEHHEFVDELQKLINNGISFLVSYDGKCGNKVYGNKIPIKSGINHIELQAGRSSQSTLLGKNEITFESLYISNDLFQKNYILSKGQEDNELFARIS